MMPLEFTMVDDVNIIADIRYATHNNFIGAPIDGYAANIIIMTKPAATALKQVAHALVLRNPNYRLRIFDAYRPQRAIAHFLRWSSTPDDPYLKARYYPEFTKASLLQNGYIAEYSSHCRGSTVDLTITACQHDSCVDLDMGSSFDRFGPISHTDNESITTTQRQNRQLLKSLMVAHGFVNLPLEWWHYTLRDEPYPTMSYDFPVAYEEAFVD